MGSTKIGLIKSNPLWVCVYINIKTRVTWNKYTWVEHVVSHIDLLKMFDFFFIILLQSYVFQIFTFSLYYSHYTYFFDFFIYFRWTKLFNPLTRGGSDWLTFYKLTNKWVGLVCPTFWTTRAGLDQESTRGLKILFDWIPT